ncbi:MAG: hypothetical protein ABR584_12180 [Candidatus Baltobacteraceae bacterium]
MRSLALITTLAVLGVCLSGCGGGAQNALPSAAGAPVQSAGKQLVTFKIDAPFKSGSANMRHPQYISPATTQMAIDIQQSGVSISGYPTTVPLTPTSGGCTSTLASTICTLAVSLAPGNYTTTLTMEDASATALSTAQSIAFTVVAGTNNTISLVLSGIPASIVAVPASLFAEPTGSNAYEILGVGSHQFMVEALDQDGNIIVGSGAPSYSIAKTGSLNVGITQPTTVAPNQFSLTPPSAFNSATATVTVTASYSGAGVTNACAQPGALCTAPLTITMGKIVAIQSNTTVNFVASDNPNLLLGTQPYAGSNNAIAADKNGDVIVDNTSPAGVRVYPPPYTSSYNLSLASPPQTITTDATGNVWAFKSSAYEFTLPLISSSTPALTMGSFYSSIPFQAVFDSAGDMFVANFVQTLEYKAPLSAGSTPFTTYTGFNRAQALTLDNQSPKNIWVVDAGASTVSEFAGSTYASGGTVAKTSAALTMTSTNGLNGPDAIASDVFSQIFIGENNASGGALLEFNPPYTSSAQLTTGDVDALSLDNNSFPLTLYATMGAGTYPSNVLEFVQTSSYAQTTDLVGPPNTRNSAVVP